MTKPRSKEKGNRIWGQTNLNPRELAAAAEAALKKTLQNCSVFISSGADVNVNVSIEVKIVDTSTKSRDSHISTGSIDDSTLGTVGVSRDSSASSSRSNSGFNGRTFLTKAAESIRWCTELNDRDRADALSYLHEVERELDEEEADWNRVDRLLTQIQAIDTTAGADLKHALAVGRVF